LGEIIAALLGLASQQSALQQQANLGYGTLNETKRSNRKQEELATSARTDAYGNRVYYIPGVGWQIDTTPTTKSILDAEQSEQLASLTEDAPRNRAAAERRDSRSKMADAEFDEAFNRYSNRYRPSEDQFIAEAQDDALDARRKGMDEANAVIARQLLRTGQGSGIGGVYKSAQDAYADDLDMTLATGRDRGRANFAQSVGGADGRDQQELGFLAGLADDTENSPVNFSGTGNQLSAQADSALQTLLATLRGNQSAETSARNNLSGVVGKSVDFSALIKAITGAAAGANKDDAALASAGNKALGFIPGLGMLA
jgi:hypothetical protein